MTTPTIALVGNTTRALQLPWIDAVMQCWCEKSRPALTTATLSQILEDDKPLTRCQLLWLVCDEPTPEGLNAILGLVHDCSLPTVVTRHGESKPFGPAKQHGVMILPQDTDPATAHAAIMAMLTQAPVFRSLQTEIKVLQAQHGGLCEQMDKVDEELRLAAQLQREFLPAKMPSIGGVEFRALWRPAGYVSGDIYDVVRLDEDHVGFFVADAVGHGVPAALMTMYIKRCLHMKAIDPKSAHGYRILPATQSMGMLNRDMCNQQTGKMRFATAWYGVMNCRTRELQYCRAGHPAPLHIRPDGRCEELDADGAMLGIFPEEEYELKTVQFDEGDRMLVFSDGFEFVFPTINEESGKPVAEANAEYTEHMKMLGEGTLEDALERLVDHMDQAAGSLNQKDDLTVVCMAINTPAGVVPIPEMSEDELTATHSR
jgi:sigma-B regulation protein RsbU (phosphoserine phosphatase)